MGQVRIIDESVAVVHFTGRLLREGFVRIRKIGRLFRRGQSSRLYRRGKSTKTYKRGQSSKGADR